jgi:integrase
MLLTRTDRGRVFARFEHCSLPVLGEGVAVPVIQDQLGHASLATTAVYLRHLAPAERIDRMRRRTWSL